MKITSNKQKLFNTVYLALIKQGEPAVRNGTCTYLDHTTGHKCAIGHLLPEGHEAQGSRGSVRALNYVYPELFKKGADVDFLTAVQRAHDHPRLNLGYTGTRWVEAFKKRMRLIAAEYKLTVPDVP